METNMRLAAALQIVVGWAVALFLVPAGVAQVIHPDQMLGTFSPQLESRPGDNPAFTESAGVSRTRCLRVRCWPRRSRRPVE